MVRIPFKELSNRLGSSHSSFKPITGFAIDSRKVQPGEVFFALSGEKDDGHAHLAEAKAKGALAAVISKTYSGPDFGLRLFPVGDVLSTMRELAKEKLDRNLKKITIGITGSVGKTTIKEFIATLLGAKFSLAKTPGSSNSQVSLPVSILNFEGNEEVLILEMGMSQPKEIENLVRMAPPDIAFLNKIALAHAAFFPGGKEEIAKAKSEIFSHPKTKLAILHQQTAQFEAIRENISCEKLFFSMDVTSADYYLKRQENGWSIKEKGRGSPVFVLPFEETHLCENFLGAATVARRLGMSWEEIFERAQLLKPFSKRFEKIEKDGVLFINDSYNANPESMRAALTNLPKPKRGNKVVAVLGAMRELGSFCRESHLEIARCALPIVDEMLCFGNECQPIIEYFTQSGRSAQLYTDFSLLKQNFRETISSGDVVLIKGSNSLQLWRLLEEEKL